MYAMNFRRYEKLGLEVGISVHVHLHVLVLVEQRHVGKRIRDPWFYTVVFRAGQMPRIPASLGTRTAVVGWQ